MVETCCFHLFPVSPQIIMIIPLFDRHFAHAEAMDHGVPDVFLKKTRFYHSLPIRYVV